MTWGISGTSARLRAGVRHLWGPFQVPCLPEDSWRTALSLVCLHLTALGPWWSTVPCPWVESLPGGPTFPKRGFWNPANPTLVRTCFSGWASRWQRWSPEWAFGSCSRGGGEVQGAGWEPGWLGSELGPGCHTLMTTGIITLGGNSHVAVSSFRSGAEASARLLLHLD